ncbi:MAG: hypothetical protein ACKV19_12510 [Verrucomicrobiales bacterium]
MTRSSNGMLYPFSTGIYNQKNNVRVLVFGTMKTKGFPVMFDGRNEKGDCGLQGGMIMALGKTDEPSDMYWLSDSSEVQIPIIAVKPGQAISMEGCEDCHLGTFLLTPGAIAKAWVTGILPVRCRRLPSGRAGESPVPRSHRSACRHMASGGTSQP